MPTSVGTERVGGKGRKSGWEREREREREREKREYEGGRWVVGGRG